MSSLKQNVPKLELCMEIPLGAFNKSIFIWELQDGEARWDVALRSEETGDPSVPAPTLQEILVDLAKGDDVFDTLHPELLYNEHIGGWRVAGRAGKVIDHVLYPAEVRKTSKNNPADAALEVWLELKHNKRRHNEKYDNQNRPLR